MELLKVLPVANNLGEGVQWNATDGAFWWTDIHSRHLYRHHLDSAETSRFDMPERLCAFAFINGAARRILAAFETGIAVYDIDTGDIDWRHRVEPSGTGRRFNDGRTDRQGRFWVGTMVEDAAKAGEASASLYRLDLDGSLHRMLDGIAISNGLCLSPDSRTLYFADSPTGHIDRFDFDPALGAIANRTRLAQMEPCQYPDGAVVDAEGFIWTAQWGGGRVLRLRPDGVIDREIALPAAQVTCVAFGGPDLDVICVTSAREGLNDAALATQPEAGNVFLFKGDVRGLIEARYMGR